MATRARGWPFFLIFNRTSPSNVLGAVAETQL